MGRNHRNKTAESLRINRIHYPKSRVASCIIPVNAALVGIASSTGRSDDNTLSMTVSPAAISFHEWVLLRNSHPLTKWGRVLDLVFNDSSQETTAPDCSSYRVEGNFELLHNLLRCLWSNRTIKLKFDEATNRILLLGRSKDHGDVIEVI